MSTTTASAATDEVVARLERIAGLYAELADLPVFALTDAKLDKRMAAAAKAANSGQEMVARIASEADAAGVADRAGCSSTRAWLISEHQMSPRDAARAARDYAAADAIRDRIKAAGIEIEDTPNGPRWTV